MFMKTKKKYNLEILGILIVFYTFDSRSEYHDKLNGIIYILLWTGRSTTPCAHWKLEQKSFTTMGCKYQNCYLVDDINFFEHMTDYDAVIFNSIDLTVNTELPKARSDNQMYIFVSTEASMNYPTHYKFDWFFNYTWTYKMNSDIYYPYFITRNKDSKVIAPNVDVKWIDIKDMPPINDSIIEKLGNKKIAAAWFVTNCYATSPRLNYLRSLRAALEKYHQKIDVFGICDANKACLKYYMDDCFALLESDYYFYLSFENTFTEDYVTEKLLTALDHYTVPVVLGGANYSRFMPDGIYLNANNLTGEEMAEKMVEAIQNNEIYYEYFKWHEHYSYHVVTDSADTDPLCTLCDFLNDASKRKQKQVYARFLKWWNGFDVNDDATGDIIVHYRKSDMIYHINSDYEEKISSSNIMTETPPIDQSVGDFVNNLFNNYFEAGD